MTGTAIAIPDTPPIPGLAFRPFDPDHDYPGVVDLIREAHLEDGIDWLPNVDNLRVDFDHTPEFDPRRDVLVAEIDGALVAATQTNVRVRDGAPVHHLDGWVRPAWRRRGLGRALLGWAEGRAREVARVDGRGGERALTAWPDDVQAGAVALYEKAGYAIVRYGFLMVRDLTQPIPDRPLPAGLEVRPVRREDHRRIWDADVEAFRDHWNHVERTEADHDRWFAIPELDTDRWQVAWDGDEVAGSVMCFVFPDENETLGISRGWLEHVSVRRPWRRRGLASALIARALVDLRGQGLAEAALGVDAENVSGALQVYESMGFRRARTSVAYRKAFSVD